MLICFICVIIYVNKDNDYYYYNDLSIMIGNTVVNCSLQVKDRGSSLIECYRYVSMFLIPQKRADFSVETFP